MCGLGGWLGNVADGAESTRVVDAMLNQMSCRGPDASGIWTREDAIIGHVRLAVVDPAGSAQPQERDGVVIALCGEVYNYRDLRKRLESDGFSFRTQGDTEVVLAGYLRWGEQVVDLLRGMYSVVLWDRPRHRGLLVRDRLGVKPLYYATFGGDLVFGSEIKAVLCHPMARRVVGLEGLRSVFAQLRPPMGETWEGVREVEPGHYLLHEGGRTTVHRYWSLPTSVAAGVTPAVARLTTGELLRSAVSEQLVADVPLCCLLSGGLDSSTIATLAAGHEGAAAPPVKTYALGFDEPSVEGFGQDHRYARRVAEAIGSDHHEVLLTAPDLSSPSVRATVVRARDLPDGLGEADHSMFLLFRAIRENSVVALSGEGADELFGGYGWMVSRSSLQRPIWPWMSSDALDSSVLGARTGLNREFERVLRLGEYVRDEYSRACSLLEFDADIGPLERRLQVNAHLTMRHFLRVMLERKDRMSMAASIEARVPFTDHRLVEYVFALPWALKGLGKRLLRAAVRDYLPSEVATRQKQPYPSTRGPEYLDAIRLQLADLVRGGTAPEGYFNVFDRGSVADLSLVPSVALTGRDRAFIERALNVAAWLRICSPQLELA